MSTIEEGFEPSKLSANHLAFLIDSIRDWQFEHGSLLKFPPKSGKIIARPIGVSVFPSNFSKSCFEEAQDIQIFFNSLYAAISCDEAWMHQALQSLIESDSMAKILWEIHCAVKVEGYVQCMSLGVFRSDYMLHMQSKNAEPILKQVEFNTYSVAGGAHSNKISEMHKYLAEMGAYGKEGIDINSSIPPNNTVESIAAGLAEAHKAYGAARSGMTSVTAILFVVQPNNVNVCDERPIEYALRNRGIASYRVEFGEDTLSSTSLTSSRDLLFEIALSTSSSFAEISVVYHRAGYDVEEYDVVGREARYQLEMSKAIKCPSILCHLATLKVVQQKLALPENLRKFLPDKVAARLERAFMPMYPLDKSDAGQKAKELALVSHSASKYVLKPSLEGGGHNIYREAIPAFLKSKPEMSWKDHILMEMIEPPMIHNILLSSRQVFSGSIISELGIFGMCLWQHGTSGVEVLQNHQAGFSFKTKGREVDEMSVVKGYGCFDSPWLI